MHGVLKPLCVHQHIFKLGVYSLERTCPLGVLAFSRQALELPKKFSKFCRNSLDAVNLVLACLDTVTSEFLTFTFPHVFPRSSYKYVQNDVRIWIARRQTGVGKSSFWYGK